MSYISTKELTRALDILINSMDMEGAVYKAEQVAKVIQELSWNTDAGTSTPDYRIREVEIKQARLKLAQRIQKQLKVEADFES